MTSLPLFQSPSAFDPRSLDIVRGKTAQNGVQPKLLRRGETLSLDHSRSGFMGWRDHFAFAEPRGTIGLTEYPVGADGRALQISTGDGPYSADSRWNSAGTYKNMALVGDWDVISFSTVVMLAGSGSLLDRVYPWAAFGIGLDMQWPGSANRAFLKAYFKDGVANTPGNVGLLIRRSNGSDLLVPGTADVVTGLNENKWNWLYLRLSISRKANGGAGGYLEMQVNNHLFDLSALGAVAADTILNRGSWDDFDFGLNPAITLERSTLNPTATKNVLTADYMHVTVNDVLANYGLAA